MVSRGQASLPAYGALALSMILVGANVPLAKYLTAHMPIAWVGMVRCGSAVAALLPMRLMGSNHKIGSLGRIAGFAVLGIAGVFIYPFFLLLGLRSTGALAAGAIAATLPAVVAILSVIVLRERTSPRLIAGIACAVGGLLLLNLAPSDGRARGGLTGNLFIMLAVCGEAGYVIMARQLAAGGASPIGMALGANIAGLCAFAVLALANGAASPPTAPALAWIGAAWFGVTSSVVALLLWFWGIRHIEAARAGVFTVFLPLTAGAVAILVLGERASALTLLGVAGVILAILLTAERRSPQLPLA